MNLDARSRAAAMLEISADAPPGTAATAFLTGLPAAGFLPPGESVAALNVLVGLAVPTDLDADHGIHQEVEEFTLRYWSLEPADRLAAWSGLNARFPTGRIAARLLTLQGGLDVPSTPLPDSTAEEIAAIARELYVLPTRDRAIRRNNWLLTNSARHKELVGGVATIQKLQPVVAALEPVLFERLSRQFDAVVFAAGRDGNHITTAMERLSKADRLTSICWHPCSRSGLPNTGGETTVDEH